MRKELLVEWSKRSFIIFLTACRMKFSKIEFTENQIDAPVGGIDSKSIGCIQLVVKKRCGVHKVVENTVTTAAKTSALKIWEQDTKIAGKMSVSTRSSPKIYLLSDDRRLF
jgi:hypothetical protein